MTQQELTQYKKLTALNAIRKLYSPKTTHNYNYREGSRMEQISFEVQQIIETLEEELAEIKKKYKIK